VNTNDFQLAQQLAAQLPANWHGLTVWHALAALLGSGWLTHANWPKIISGFKAVQSYCDTRTAGILVIAFRIIFGSPKPVENQVAIPQVQPAPSQPA
jgi:hypothetical protein